VSGDNRQFAAPVATIWTLAGNRKSLRLTLRELPIADLEAAARARHFRGASAIEMSLKANGGKL